MTGSRGGYEHGALKKSEPTYSADPGDTDESIRRCLKDLAATERFACALADAIEDKAIIALNGQLGTGKTAIVQFVARQLGVQEVVNSPTFTMMNEYHTGRLPLYHLDLYRLSEPGGNKFLTALNAELDDILWRPCLIMIEWAQLIYEVIYKECISASANFLSSCDHLLLDLSYGKENADESIQSRIVTIAAKGPQSQKLLDRLDIS